MRPAGRAESDPAWFEMGLLKRSDWKARWIGAALVGGPRSTIPAPFLRKSFQLAGEVKTARLYVTALGLYECSINGQPVGDTVFAPGWTDYQQASAVPGFRRYRPAAPRARMCSAPSWATAGRLGTSPGIPASMYFDRPRLLAQLEITLDDGRTVTIATDRTWKYQFGPLLENDLLMGEAYDARLELPGWDAPGFDDKRWLGVELFDDPGHGSSSPPTDRPCAGSKS